MAQLREILAHNLKKKRRECGFTQGQLAEKVKVSTHHIATIETARNYPTLDLVERIANTLEIEIYELFIDPLSPHEELERLYHIVAKNIENVVSEAIETILLGKRKDQIIEIKLKDATPEKPEPSADARNPGRGSPQDITVKSVKSGIPKKPKKKIK
ncbi:MAG: helix-turn-helix domain-containing protein [Treponema sp.]|jgi:transcriptional regulator with XRE-family HTH domain|nr:helix-turn-helix domain-containing protein [Treponema sp.]